MSGNDETLGGGCPSFGDNDPGQADGPSQDGKDQGQQVREESLMNKRHEFVLKANYSISTRQEVPFGKVSLTYISAILVRTRIRLWSLSSI